MWADTVVVGHAALVAVSVIVAWPRAISAAEGVYVGFSVVAEGEKVPGPGELVQSNEAPLVTVTPLKVYDVPWQIVASVNPVITIGHCAAA